MSQFITGSFYLKIKYNEINFQFNHPNSYSISII